MFGEGSLIPADNNFAVMAGLFVIAALGFLAEKTRIGALVTGLHGDRCSNRLLGNMARQEIP